MLLWESPKPSYLKTRTPDIIHPRPEPRAYNCNANTAELTVEYCTLYGDLGGFLLALGDLWKSEVYALGLYLNEMVYGRELNPEGIFTLVPSANFSARHAVDLGKGDPLVYPYHDRLFCS